MTIFDKFVSQYDEWYSGKKGNFIDMVETELVFKMLEIEKGMKILDAGCGTGNFSIKLAKMGCQVTGIDTSGKMLEIARAKISTQPQHIDFIKMDIQDLKFSDNEFDAVISMAAFEFIVDPKQALGELFRVVKIGGQVLVGTIAGDSIWGEFYKSNKLRENTVFKHTDFKTLQELQSWKQQNLVDTGECLFISPYADEAEFNSERENDLAGKRKGGFICVLWKK